MKVTVVGAGRYGSATVARIAEADCADEVVMLDIIDGLPQGLALDINQSRQILGHHTRVVGTNDYDDTAGSDVVVVTAGKLRRPGMSRHDLLQDNAEIVSAVAVQVARCSPDAVVVMVSNPLDEMTALFQRVTRFPPARVVGQAGVLDAARFADRVAARTGVAAVDVEAVTLGSHGDTLVAVPSQVRVQGRPLRDVLSDQEIREVVEGTRGSGLEIAHLLRTGSAFFAPSAAAARMVRAIANDEGAVLSACAWVDDAYGLSELWFGVPVRLGRTGVQEIVELDLTDDERAALHEAADVVRDRQADVEQVLAHP